MGGATRAHVGQARSRASASGRRGPSESTALQASSPTSAAPSPTTRTSRRGRTHLACARAACSRRYVAGTRSDSRLARRPGRFDALEETDHVRAISTDVVAEQSRTLTERGRARATGGGLRAARSQRPGRQLAAPPALSRRRDRRPRRALLPAAPRQDPILLDHERERLNAKGPAPIPLARARRGPGTPPVRARNLAARGAPPRQLPRARERQRAGRSFPRASTARSPRRDREAGAGARGGPAPELALRASIGKPYRRPRARGRPEPRRARPHADRARSRPGPGSRSSRPSRASSARSRRNVRASTRAHRVRRSPRCRRSRLSRELFDPSRRRQPIAARGLRGLPPSRLRRLGAPAPSRTTNPSGRSVLERAIAGPSFTGSSSGSSSSPRRDGEELLYGDGEESGSADSRRGMRPVRGARGDGLPPMWRVRSAGDARGPAALAGQ